MELLREQRETAIERATDSILSRYISELEKMQKSMTLSGKLEEAVGVKRELAGIHGETEKPLALGGGDSELAKELIGTSWEIKQSGGTIMAKFGDGMFRVHKQGSDGNYFPGAGRT